VSDYDLNAIERESIITMNDSDGYVDIRSHQGKVIRRLEADDRFETVHVIRNEKGVERVGHFRIPTDKWSPVTGAKRRSNLTEEEKAERGRRLRGARNAD
jgi:hypothetical protein